MKINFTSIKTPISDFYEDNGIVQKDIDEDLIIKWAKDIVRDITTDEQWVHRLAWLDVSNYKIEIPDDFIKLMEISYKVKSNKTNCEVKGYQIVQYVQNTHDDCELELNVTCPSCHETSCNDCHTNDVIVDINTAFEISHPEMFYTKYKEVGRFGYGNSIYDESWKILCHTNNDYFGLNAHLPDCANIHCTECPHSYRIEMPYIETSFEKGEVLLSYMGRKLDENGEIMIPDHRFVHEAILQHLTYKWFRREYLTKGNSLDKDIYREAKIDRDNFILKANIALGTPSADEFAKFWASSKWVKIENAYSNLLEGGAPIVNLPTRNIYKS